MIFSLLLATQAVALTLPDHVGIPEGHSTVICPSVESAKTMLLQHHRVKPAPNNHGINTDEFFAGIKATGCSQDSPSRKGEVIVQSVVARITLTMADGDERYIVYRGVNKFDGSPLIGIVNEDSNNSFARTDVARFMVGHASDGWLDARDNANGNRIIYRCDSPSQAKTVVEKLSGMETSASKKFTADLKKHTAAQKCKPASDRYFVTQILTQAGNSCGDECYVDLNALEAIDRSGIRVGLVFDASLM
jgi:hypothetical protein